jgi:arginyl-tRNA synthetase
MATPDDRRRTPGIRTLQSVRFDATLDTGKISPDKPRGGTDPSDTPRDISPLNRESFRRMPSITASLDAAFRKAIRDAFSLDADPAIAPAANPQFGDYQCNAAMALSKRVSETTGQKANPRQIAEQLVAKLDLGLMVIEKPGIAGPGFINVRLNPQWLAQQLQVSGTDERLGANLTGTPQTVVIDYSAPNVAKEMHVGHLRSTIIGDCYARLLAFLGHTVIRQNHLGDWGTQFGMLIEHLTSIGGDASSQLSDLEGFYRDAKKRFDAEPGFAERARSRVVKLQSGQAEELQLWRQIVAVTQRYIQGMYARLHVLLRPTDECGESFYNPLLSDVVSDLVASGIAVESDGAKAVFVEGFEAPLIIQKSDGGYGYATTDLAAVRHRIGTLKADRVIYVVGLPQSQHFQQVFATARKAGWITSQSFEHAGFGSVLGEDGKIFRTRAGGTVKLADLLDEAEQRALELVTAKSPDLPEADRKAIARSVGIGAVKYFDLLRDRVGDYKFSFDAMLAMDGNTAPYLQYAHARVCSIFRKAGAERIAGGLTILAEPTEKGLAMHLMRFGETLDAVARELKPHLLCTYLYDLAGRFSSFYEACPVIDSPEPTRASRLALCDQSARTLAKGLELLGIDAPQRM